MSPFQALFGRQMTIGIDLALLKEFDSAPNTQAFTADLVSKLQLTHHIIKKICTTVHRDQTFFTTGTLRPQKLQSVQKCYYSVMC